MKKDDFIHSTKILKDIRALIVESRRETTVVVNVGLTVLYWKIGNGLLRKCLVANVLRTAKRLSPHFRALLSLAATLICTSPDHSYLRISSKRDRKLVGAL
jgi:hypothetical protein